MLSFGFEQGGGARSKTAQYAHAMNEILNHYPPALTIPPELQATAVSATFNAKRATDVLEKIFPILHDYILEQQHHILASHVSYEQQFLASASVRQLHQHLIVAMMCIFVDVEALNLSKFQEESQGSTGAHVMAFSGGSDITQHIQMMHQTLLLLLELQLFYAATYHNVPAGFWHNVHTTYALATHQKTEQRTLALGDEAPISIQQRYNQCLLLSMFKPHSLLHSDRNQVKELLRQWCSSVEVRYGLNRADLYCLCWELDQGPVYQSLLSGKQAKEKNWISIDTFLVAEQLTKLLKRMEQKDENSTRMGDCLLSKSFVKRLELALTTKPARKFKRTETEPEASQQTLILLDKANFDNKSVQTWEKINSSAGGYRFRVEEQDQEIAVGGLLLLPVTATNHSLATIRWIEHDNQQQLFVGIELLSPYVQEVQAHHEEQVMNVLYLPDVTSLAVQESLVVPENKVKENDMVVLPQGKIILGEQIESRIAADRYNIIWFKD